MRRLALIVSTVLFIYLQQNPVLKYRNLSGSQCNNIQALVFSYFVAETVSTQSRCCCWQFLNQLKLSRGTEWQKILMGTVWNDDGVSVSLLFGRCGEHLPYFLPSIIENNENRAQKRGTFQMACIATVRATVSLLHFPKACLWSSG